MIEDLPGEVWKDVVGFEGYFQISNKFRMKRINRIHNLTGSHMNDILINPKIKGNSISYAITKNKIHVNKTVQQWVYEAFYEPIKEGFTATGGTFETLKIIPKNDVYKQYNFKPGDVYRGATIIEVQPYKQTYKFKLQCPRCCNYQYLIYVKRFKDDSWQCKDCQRMDKVANTYNIDIISHYRDEHNQLYYKAICKYCGNPYSFKASWLTSRNFPDSCKCRQHPNYWINKSKTGEPLKQKYICLYRKWVSMRQRCYNAKDEKEAKTYQNKETAHNGIGIRVCKYWRDSFENFLEWALAHNWEEKNQLSIDRIDPDGNYAPYNCQFITMSENTIKANTSDRAAKNSEEIRKANYIKYRQREEEWVEYMEQQGYKKEDIL